MVQANTLTPRVDTANVDDEIACVAGPQLVVPVTNARYALNAANARWGSLYDALYGTDVIPEDNGATRGGGYNPTRGARVFAWTKRFLDEVAPLARGSHAAVRGYAVQDGGLVVSFDNVADTWLDSAARLIGLSSATTPVGLADPAQLVGYRGDPSEPRAILLRHNGLHIEIQIDSRHYIGKNDKAGVADVLLEAAITTIVDLRGLDRRRRSRGQGRRLPQLAGPDERHAVETFVKGGAEMTRRLNPDRVYTTPDGETLTLHGRSLLLVRNVGHLMMDASVLDRQGKPAPEGILDCVITSLIAMHDLKRTGIVRNSRAGSIYIVKPKMHGADEVTFAGELFDRTEDALGLPRNTLKIGIMDEERRTTVNLKECIRAAHGIASFFINTGFLDRTGDEIHTSMEAGPMIRKGDMRSTRLDQGLRGLERRHRPSLRPAGTRPDRQGHVGNARSHGRHDGAEDRPPGGRRQYGVGALADRRNPARDPLPQGRRGRAPGGAALTAARVARPYPHHTGRGPRQLVIAGCAGGARQQRAGHPGLRGALDRPGRRLLQGARHQ